MKSLSHHIKNPISLKEKSEIKGLFPFQSMKKEKILRLKYQLRRFNKKIFIEQLLKQNYVNLFNNIKFTNKNNDLKKDFQYFLKKIVKQKNSFIKNKNLIRRYFDLLILKNKNNKKKIQHSSFYKNSHHLKKLYKYNELKDVNNYYINTLNPLLSKKLEKKKSKKKKSFSIEYNLTQLSKLIKLNDYYTLSIYHLPIISKFINIIMRNGNKSAAEKIFYKNIIYLRKKIKKNIFLKKKYIKRKKMRSPLFFINKAINFSKPEIYLKSVLLRGRKVQSPKPLTFFRQYFLAMREIIEISKEGKRPMFIKNLGDEIFNCAEKKGKILLRLNRFYKSIREYLVHLKPKNKKNKIKKTILKKVYSKHVVPHWLNQYHGELHGGFAKFFMTNFLEKIRKEKQYFSLINKDSTLLNIINNKSKNKKNKIKKNSIKQKRFNTSKLKDLKLKRTIK